VYSCEELADKMTAIIPEGTEKELIEFLGLLDPYKTNSVARSKIERAFSYELIESKIKVFARPNYIIN
jgi:hypothetical protein